MFPFDVILFDVGGVLLTNGWDHAERAAAMAHFGLDRAPFEARHAAPNDAWERDVIPVKAYLDSTVFYESRPFSHDDFIAFMLTQSKLLPDGALGILGELAASDHYLLGALNNEARETNEYRFRKFGLRKLFRVALSSATWGCASRTWRSTNGRSIFWAGSRSAFCLSMTARRMSPVRWLRECMEFSFTARRVCGRS
jgi:putative hydrolase of the HAD superfamily